MSSTNDDSKLPLPEFLKIFTSNGVPIPKAMLIAGKIYKEHHTRTTLAQINDLKLKALGVDNNEDRKVIITALRKGGYAAKARTRKKVNVMESPAPGGSTPSTATAELTPARPLPTPVKRKRKQSDGMNEFLPDESVDEEEGNVCNLKFDEILDEEILIPKSAVINRAPVMMAWATLVAERMYFSREEALSIASVYTEMNAVTKGVYLGIYDKSKERGSEATKSGRQPYVDLMGRRPLYRNKAGGWRGLSNGSPVPPENAFRYILRSFRQTTQYIIGALRLLAESYTSQDLNQKAWSLYAEFRPAVNEWGSRSEVRCKTILDLRKKYLEPPAQPTTTSSETQKPMINNEASSLPGVVDEKDEAPRKKTKFTNVAEYEAFLDQNTTFDNVDLNFADVAEPAPITSHSTSST